MRTKINESAFNGQDFFIGIDVHKKSWTVTILNEQHEHKTMTQPPQPQSLINYLAKHFPGGRYHAVYEAGFSGFGACRELKAAGVNCMVVNPADVPTNGKEKLQKTDSVDSRKLARSLRAKELIAINIPSPSLEADRALLRQRFTFVKNISRTKHQIKSLLMQFGIEIPAEFSVSDSRILSKKYLIWIRSVEISETNVRQCLDNYLDLLDLQKKQLLLIEKQILELSKQQQYAHNMELLRKIPGIGFNTAIYFLIQIGDIKRFKTQDELCSYIGLIPSMHESGEKSSTGHLINRGRREIKIMLIEASWDAVRLDPAMMVCFNELSKKMPKNKAIIRIARKLVNRMRYVLNNQASYEIGVVK